MKPTCRAYEVRKKHSVMKCGSAPLSMAAARVCGRVCGMCVVVVVVVVGGGGVGGRCSAR